MLKRNWALIALVYLVFAEVLSWTPVPDLSLCLIKPGHSEQATEHKYCPTFRMGVIAGLDAIDGFLERHDKSVVGAFTIVLAVSTIGLWLATINLWKAGERQLELLSETAAGQSRDMQDSIAVARGAAEASKRSAEASLRASEISEEIFRKFEVPYLSPVDLKYSPAAIDALVSISFRNYGRYPAILREAWIILAVTRPENPSKPLLKTDRIPFMVEGMIGDKETCDPITFRTQDINRYADQIASGALHLNLMIHVAWEDAMDHQRGTGQWFVWNRTRGRFVAGVQLWTEN